MYVCMYVCVDMRQSHCLTHFFFVFFPLGWLVAIQARARARSISIPFLWWRVRQSIASITWITCARFVLCVCTVLRDLDWLLPLCVCVFFFFFFFCLFLPPALSFCFCLLLLLLQTYECSEAAKHVVTAEVPVGETAALHLPSALGGVVTPTTPAAPVYDMARGELDGVDTTVVSLPGGFHSFTVHQ